MARLLDQRLVLEGDLLFSTPLSLAGARGGIAVDILVMRNGAGAACIPGTSIAGAIRGYFSQFGEGRIWGGPGANDEGPIEAGKSPGASLLRFEDAELLESSANGVEIRDHVVIDRETGGACERLKFNREIVPAGASFKLRIAADVPAGEPGLGEELHGLLLSVKSALEAGFISFGGSATRGFGRASLTKGAIAAIPLAKRKEFLKFLVDGNASAGGLPQPGNLLAAPAELTIAVKLVPLGPIMVKSGIDGLAVDALPLLSKTGDGKRQVVPGASIKGVLRGIAERIMRTLFDEDMPAAGKPSERMLEVLGDKSNELVAALFGRPRPDGAGSGQSEGAQKPGRGAVSIDDLYAGDAVAEAAWFKPLDSETGNLPSGGPKYGAANHVAIDRWTGGAAETKLFSAVEPWDIELAPLKITVSAKRLAAAKGREKAALALLYLTLREFALNCPGIGHGVTRGYGQVSMKSATFTVAGDTDKALLEDFAGLNMDNEFPMTAPKLLQDAWTAYLKEKNCK